MCNDGNWKVWPLLAEVDIYRDQLLQRKMDKHEKLAAVLKREGIAVER
jgi:hypothetical protein